MEEANARKKAKYEELVAECRCSGWRARNEPIEVGCRGFAGRSLVRTLAMLGVGGAAVRKCLGTVSKEAERASRWLWICREKPWG